MKRVGEYSSNRTFMELKYNNTVGISSELKAF